MAWLIGAIVAYGIVVLLIGITVMVYLLGGDSRLGAEAAQSDRVSRQWPDHARPVATPRQGAASGTHTLALR